MKIKYSPIPGWVTDRPVDRPVESVWSFVKIRHMKGFNSFDEQNIVVAIQSVPGNLPESPGWGSDSTGLDFLLKGKYNRPPVHRIVKYTRTDVVRTRFSRKRLRLHQKDRKSEKNLLISYCKPFKINDLSERTIRRELYYFGKNIIIHKLIYLNLLDIKTLNYINDYKIPKIPLTGKDLIKEGWQEGRDMGDKLKQFEKK